MALSEDYKILVFQILGIPITKPSEFYEDLSGRHTVNRDLMLYQQDLSLWPYEYSVDAINAVNARIAVLTPVEETRVSDLCDAWDEISQKTVKVKTDTVELNYSNERAQIRRLMKIIIPITVRGGFANDNPSVSVG